MKMHSSQDPTTPAGWVSSFSGRFSSRKTAVTDDVWLHHVGGGEGTPVILLHGFPQSWYMWRKVMPALAEEYRIVAPDLRGCGDSEKLHGPYDAWTLAGDIADLLDELGVTERAFVVGHDMGAPVALSFAARYPGRSRGLVYIDEPVFGINLEKLAAFSGEIPNMVWWWPFHHQPGLAETMLPGHERAYFDFFAFNKTHATNLWAWTEDDKEEYVRHLRELGGITGALGGYRDVFVTEERLAPFKTEKLTVPALGITGEYGLPDVAEALGGYVAEVEAAEIADSGHFVAEEQPEALIETLTGFFSRGRLMHVATVNHTGLTTPDIYGAIDWYGSQFGLRLIMGPRVLDASPETRRIFGDTFGKAYQAHLIGPDGFGLELFQFVEPAVEGPEERYAYTHRGFSHVCFTVADIDEAAGRVEDAGGSVVSPPAEFVPGRPWRLAYCRDPWGTVIELMSHTYAECFTNWPQPGAEATTRVLDRDGGERDIRQ